MTASQRILSVRGVRCTWLVASADTRCCQEIMRMTSFPAPLVHALVARGLTTGQAIQDFIYSTAIAHEVDGTLLHAQRAVDRIMQAIERSEKILICGDYDVDGMTSTSLLMICLRPLGAHVNFFLPHRIKDGYGLSIKTVEQAHAHGFTLMITVDNGTTAFPAAIRARELGIDLIVTDHHKPRPDQLPEVYALVNPHQPGCPYPFKDFAGVGVAFKCMQLLYQLKGMPLPEAVYELMALGTIADVVPLRGENRYWVQEGLRRMQKVRMPAITYMMQGTHLGDKVDVGSRDIGFVIAPQLNALGRLDDPRDAVGFLLGMHPDKMQYIARRLKELNEERKRIEQQVFHNIVDQLESRAYDYASEPLIFMYESQWPAGVIGLIAGKLMHQFGVPVIILCGSSDSGIYKGSCRSPAWCNIVQVLEQAQDLIIQFGGHPAAAGLSVRADQIAALRERLMSIVQALAQGQLIGPILVCDAPLILSDVTQELGTALALLEPFGASNAEPVFYIARATIMHAPQLLKDAHVKVMLYDDGMIKPIIFFKRPELFAWFQARIGHFCRVVAQISRNEWQGQTRYELQGLDVADYEDIENCR